MTAAPSRRPHDRSAPRRYSDADATGEPFAEHMPVRQFLPSDAPPFAYVAQSYLRLGWPWREVAEVVGKSLDEVVLWCSS